MNLKSIITKHTVVWLIFISYELAYLYFTVGIKASLIHFGVYYGLNIILFYINAHIVLDFSFFKTKAPYLIAITLTVTELLIYLIVKYWLDFLVGNSHYIPIFHTSIFKQYLVTNIWRAIYFIGLSIAYWSMLYMIRFKDRNHQMETEQLKNRTRTLELENKYISVENAYLQNQISPHLLFNSLSFIHNLVYKESGAAGDSVSRLADLMRYSLVSADDSRTVSLHTEVAQLENLVELCRMRFKEQFYLRFKKKGKLSSAKIIPLILITLVENMMKHGDMGHKKFIANITVQLDGGRLYFETRNKKRNTNLYPKSGLGLKNIEKRLSNYYQKGYELLLLDEEELFTVKLRIDL